MSTRERASAPISGLPPRSICRNNNFLLIQRFVSYAIGEILQSKEDLCNNWAQSRSLNHIAVGCARSAESNHQQRYNNYRGVWLIAVVKLLSSESTKRGDDNASAEFSISTSRRVCCFRILSFFSLPSWTWPERRGEDCVMPVHERSEEGDDTLGKQITITCFSRTHALVRHAESRKNEEEREWPKRHVSTSENFHRAPHSRNELSAVHIN